MLPRGTGVVSLLVAPQRCRLMTVCIPQTPARTKGTASVSISDTKHHTAWPFHIVLFYAIYDDPPPPYCLVRTKLVSAQKSLSLCPFPQSIHLHTAPLFCQTNEPHICYSSNVALTFLTVCPNGLGPHYDLRVACGTVGSLGT